MESVEQKLDFESVYEKHAPFVRRTLAKRGVPEADLDDVVQDVFVTVHRLLPTFEGRSSLETWLYSVSWRIAAAHRRTASKRYVQTSEQTERSLADGPVKISPDKAFHASFGQIEEQHRDVVALHDLAGFSISEVSDLTGNARATIRERLERGRTALGRKLWQSLTATSDDPVWLDRLAPRLAARLAQPERPATRHVVVDQAAISTLDDIVLVLWRGHSSAPALEALIEVMFAAIDRYPDGIRYLSIVEPTSTPPTREGRQLISWGTGKMGHKLRAAGWAVEEQRMMSRLAPLMNACFFIGGVPFNIRFFDSVPPASRWLTEYGSLQPAEISAHVEVMRAQLKPV